MHGSRFSPDAMSDVRSGLVDARVMALLERLSRGHDFSVRLIKTGHPMGPTSPAGRDNAHYFYRAVDIDSVDGIEVSVRPIAPPVVALGQTLMALDTGRSVTCIWASTRLGDPAVGSWNPPRSLSVEPAVSNVSGVIGFPNPVNEKAARVVAGWVLLLGLVTLASGWHWLLLVLAVGFLARVLAGPRYSLIGQLATRVIAPRLGPAKLVPGPPKQFAQGIGLVVTGVASVFSLALGVPVVATVLLAVLVAFAALESIVGFCFGCWVFGRLMRLGVIPESVCEACATYAGGPIRVTGPFS